MNSGKCGIRQGHVQDLQASRIIQIQEVGGLHHRYERRAA
jgi:hypothetical protein